MFDVREFGVMCSLCIVLCFARLVDLVFFEYVDGFFCSIHVNLV